MKGANIPASSWRQYETGLVWIELLSGATGKIAVSEYTTCRIRATGASKIYLESADGSISTLACTMIANEVIRLNVGRKLDSDNTVTVRVDIAGAYISIGKEHETY